MKYIDGHSHVFHDFAPSDRLKKTVEEIRGFDINKFLDKLDGLNIDRIQTMPQEMTRVRNSWLGSNDLSVNLHHTVSDRIVAFVAAEPLDSDNKLNTKRLAEIREYVEHGNLQGLLLTPPYGHYYSNDRRIYPFYELAVELDIPIYFHHSHMFGPANSCPLKYARI